MSYVQDGYVEPGYFSEPLTTRTLNNVAEGFSGISGVISSAWTIAFTLVDANGKPTTATDGTSGHELVNYGVRGVIDSTNGEFSVPLWPTDRSVAEVYYRCRILERGLDRWPMIVRPFPAGDLSDMLFSTFKAQDRWA